MCNSCGLRCSCRGKYSVSGFRIRRAASLDRLQKCSFHNQHFLKALRQIELADRINTICPTCPRKHGGLIRVLSLINTHLQHPSFSFRLEQSFASPRVKISRTSSPHFSPPQPPFTHSASRGGSVHHTRHPVMSVRQNMFSGTHVSIDKPAEPHWFSLSLGGLSLQINGS